MTVLFGLLRVGLGLTLLLAGLGKVTVMSDFTSSAERFIPATVQHYARQVAIAVVAVEIVIGLSTLLIPSSRLLDVVVVALFAGLLAISVIGYQRYRGSSCRCFGPLSKGEFNRLAIARNTLLALAACSVLVFEPAQRIVFPTVPWIVSAIAVAVVSAAFLEAAAVLARLRREI